MTDLIEPTQVERVDEDPPGSPPQRRTSRFPGGRPALVVLLAVVLVAGVIAGVSLTKSDSSPRSASSGVGVRLITNFSRPYTPVASDGGTDDYHCTLVNPHITKNSFVVWSQFKPGNGEVHHAVVSIVAPSLAAQALAANASTGGKGWTCFGAPSLPNASSVGDLLSTPYLGEWAPGHGADALPKGTGVLFPPGSLLIEQVHYNLLVGDKPVRNSLVLKTVPASAPLLPLHDTMAIAPPEIPCPTGVTGPLCNRSAELVNLGQRFGPLAAQTPNLLASACGQNPSDPPLGDTASCTWPINVNGSIVRAQGHMHLLGVGFSLVLNPGTPQARTIVNVPNYSFHYQRAYNLSTPIRVQAGDKLQVNCRFDPDLAQELPILRKLPPHFVTFGDGSSDEMCVGLVWTTSSAPNLHSAL
jgi:hypothetical protein